MLEQRQTGDAKSLGPFGHAQSMRLDDIVLHKFPGIDGVSQFNKGWL